MRIIDVDALKETVELEEGIFWDSYSPDELVIRKKYIDNAPTVEVPENAVNCVLTMFGKCSYNKTGCSDCEIKDKIRKALKERPQGRWYYNCQNGWHCSICHEIVKDMPTAMRTPIYNFCPNCGAKLGGEEE